MQRAGSNGGNNKDPVMMHEDRPHLQAEPPMIPTVVAVVHVAMSTTEDLYALEDDLLSSRVPPRQKASRQEDEWSNKPPLVFFLVHADRYVKCIYLPMQKNYPHKHVELVDNGGACSVFYLDAPPPEGTHAAAWPRRLSFRAYRWA